jgi:hypothetical protein
MLAALSLPESLTTAGKAHHLGGDTNSLLWPIVVVVTLALGVIAAIAIADWRAQRAIKQARSNWADFGPRHRAGVDIVRANPLRRK